MITRDIRVLALSLAALTVFTTSSFCVVNRKAQEYESRMSVDYSDTLVPAEPEAEEETEIEVEETEDKPEVIIIKTAGIPGENLEVIPVTAETKVEPVTVETTTASETTTVETVAYTGAQDLGTFKLTAYCACPQCCGEWSDGITYTGTVATAGRTVAVDPKVIPLGSTVNINGHAYVAEDTGGAIKGNRIDIFFSSHSDALEFGVQYLPVSIEK